MRGVNAHGYAWVGSKCERGLELDHPPFASIEVISIGTGRSTSKYVLDQQDPRNI